MRLKSTSRKEKLSNFSHCLVLEFIGSSSEPLSSTQIERKYPGGKNSYCYTLVKDLRENGFLEISYKENIAQEKQELQRNQRYLINLKGLLLYLFSAHINKSIKPTTINKITKNFSYCNPEFDFITHLDVFEDEKNRANLLVNIALELQNQLIDITIGQLSNYMIKRIYSDIAEEEARSSIKSGSIWPSVVKKENEYLIVPPTERQLEDKRTNEIKAFRFWNYKIKVLDKLIKILETDLREAKKQLEFEKELPRYPPW